MLGSPGRYEILDHTADIGLVIYGKDLKALFQHAGEAFFELITDVARVRPREARRIELSAEPLERLMVDWLHELLYLHEVEGLLFNRFLIESVGPEGLKATVQGEPFQEGIHEIKAAVKAVTYHQIEVKRENGGWRAKVILDL
ncbi:MAG: archease [Desulfobacterota bacterium]|nr:archease [Thermodesulfobacteriota bacterium]